VALVLVLIGCLAVHFLAGNVLLQSGQAANFPGMMEQAHGDDLAPCAAAPAEPMESHTWLIFPAALPQPHLITFSVFQPPKI
jgi:preprotein translocase subunit SecG